MRTSDQIKTEITAIRAEFAGIVKEDKDRKRAEKRISFLSDCEALLISGVSETHLSNEKNRLQKEIATDSKGFDTWLGSLDGKRWTDENRDSKPITHYRDICGIPEKERQIKNIEFLLS